jgi:hypothetical protein
MDAEGPSEVLVAIYHSAQRQITEYSNLQACSLHYENLNSQCGISIVMYFIGQK